MSGSNLSFLLRKCVFTSALFPLFSIILCFKQIKSNENIKNLCAIENLYKAFITFIRKFLAINIHSSMPKYMKELSDGAKK